MAISNSDSGGAADRFTQCARCQGLLIPDTFDGREDIWYRCVACGNVVDTVILDNRSKGYTDLSHPYYQR